MQVTQQVFVVEEQVKDACNQVRAKAHSHVEAKKSLGALKQEQTELANKLIASERARQSAEAGLKSLETQAEDQRQQLRITEINLATQRQLVLDLKAELQKANDAVRVARETSKAIETTSYEREVQDTETRLAEKVAGMCRDYYAKIWAKALNQAGVSVDSELRRAGNIFLPEDIQEVPATLPPPEQLPTTQAPPLDAEVSKGAGKGKEAQSPMKAKHSEDALTIKNVVSQAKDVEFKSKARDSQSETTDPKKDPPQAKAQLQKILFYFLYYYYFNLSTCILFYFFVVVVFHHCL